MMKKWISMIMSFLLVCISTTTCLAAEETAFVWSNQSNSIVTNQTVETATEPTETEEVTEETASVPDNSSATNSLNLTCGGAVLIEQHTGKVLYDHNMHEQLRPASVTKIMSILLIMEALDNETITLQDKIPCSETAASMGGSQIWLNTTEELTVDEMLKAICVVSANDCVVAMAEYLAGSEEAFVQQMNQRAQELGMKDTCFKNCHGIDEDGHVTSAYDIALMSKELLNNHPSITQYTTIWMDTLRDGKSQLVNTNKLIRNYQGATGLKTGSTSVALYNLSASATRKDLNLIAVVMKAETTKVRFAEAQKLLDYGFSHYMYKQLAKQGDIVQQLPVTKGLTNQIEVGFETDVGILLNKQEESQIEQTLQLPESISAPIYKGDKIGEVQYTLNGNIIATANLVAQQDVTKDEFSNILTKVYENWFSILRKG